MYVLSGHVALGEEEDFFAGGFVFGEVYDDDGVSGGASFYEDGADFDFVCGDGCEFFFEGEGSCVCEDEFEVLTELVVGVVGLGFFDPVGFVSFYGDSVSVLPFGVFGGEAVCEVEFDFVVFLLCEEVFGTEAHYGVGALLEVFFADVYVYDSGVYVVGLFYGAVVVEGDGSFGFEG